MRIAPVEPNLLERASRCHLAEIAGEGHAARLDLADQFVAVLLFARLDVSSVLPESPVAVVKLAGASQVSWAAASLMASATARIARRYPPPPKPQITPFAVNEIDE